MNDLLAKIRKIIGILCFLNEKIEKSGIFDLSVALGIPKGDACYQRDARRYFRSEKLKYIWFFAHLFVSLNFVLRYFRSEIKKKSAFLFVFRSLIRIFAPSTNDLIQIRMKTIKQRIVTMTTMLAIVGMTLLTTSCLDKVRRILDKLDSDDVETIDRTQENVKEEEAREVQKPFGIESVEDTESAEEERYTPLTDAIKAGSDGGEFRQLESGETVYIYPESEIFARNVWVEDHDGQVYYMDVSGCRMPSNQAPDGFFTNSRGAWDKNRPATTERIMGEQMNHTYNDSQQGMESDQWVFTVNRIGKGTVEHKYSFGTVERYECLPLGINAFRLRRENDDFVQCHVVLMAEGRQVCISGGGATKTYYAE